MGYSALTILVTGADGYLGGRLVRALDAAGVADVRETTRQETPWMSAPSRVVDLLGDEGTLRSALDGASVVVHLAGLNEVAMAADPARAFSDTIAMAHNVLRASVDAGTKRVVYVSTVHVYGAALRPGARVTEDTVPAPLTEYAASRLAVEHLLATGPTELVVFRLTNAIGCPVAPSVNRWSLVANDLCRQGVTTGSLQLRSDGMQWRDFVALDDVCRCVIAATDPVALPPGTYNLASGTSITVRELAERIQAAMAALLGAPIALEAPAPAGPPQDPYTATTERLAAHNLGAEIGLERPIRETVQFCIDHRDALLVEAPA